jgi:hypothetical protein
VIVADVAHEYTASGSNGDNVEVAVTVMHSGDPSLHGDAIVVVQGLGK